MIETVSRQLGVKSLSLLEVAAGAGYVPTQVAKRLASAGRHLEITLLDRVPSHLPTHSPANGFRAVVGNALALPFPDASFDLISCSLFAHHLAPEEVVAFAREGLRVCRHAVLINDLVRSALHLALVYAATPLFGSRITRHDAPASVRQAYTPGEIRKLLRQAGADRITIQRHYLYRMGVIAWKPSARLA